MSVISSIFAKKEGNSRAIGRIFSRNRGNSSHFYSSFLSCKGLNIKKEQVTIYSGLHSIEHTLSMKRSDTHVVVAQPDHPTDPIGLNLTDSKSRFELGTFLNKSDKIATRQALKQAGLNEFNSKWWRSLPSQSGGG